MGQLKYHDGTNWKYIDLPDQNNSSLYTNVALIGVVNGTNKVFTTPVNFATLTVYKNGVRLRPGTGNDYTITGPNQITFTTAPAVTTPETILLADLTTRATVNIEGTNSFVTHEVPTGLKNGTNLTFTTAQPYNGNSLEVYRNGIREKDIVESNPATGEFKTDVAPLATDHWEVAYQTTMATSGNADTVDGYHASVTPAANTIPVLDSSGVMPFAAFPNVVGQVTSSTNPGTAGGTRNSVNLGGLLIQWGTTSVLAAPANSEFARGIDFASPFASAPSFTAFMSTTSGSVVSNFITGNNVATTNASIYWRNSTGSSGIGGAVSWLAIGRSA